MPSAIAHSAAARRFRLSGAIVLSALLLAGCTQPFEETPEISSVAPNPVKVGATVTIKGKNLPTDSPPKVSIGGKDAPVLSYFDTKITVRVPAGSESGGITVDIGGLLLDADLTVESGQVAAADGDGSALEPLFQVPLEGLKIDAGSSGTAELSDLFDPKEAKDVIDVAEAGGFNGAYIGVYKSNDLSYVSIIGIQMDIDQAAVNLAKAWEKYSEDPYKKGYEVHQDSGTLADGTPYSGFDVPITTTDDTLFLVAVKGSTVFSIRLVGPSKLADEAPAAKWLGFVVGAGLEAPVPPN